MTSVSFADALSHAAYEVFDLFSGFTNGGE
jgi:hypothetical protein